MKIQISADTISLICSITLKACLSNLGVGQGQVYSGLCNPILEYRIDC